MGITASTFFASAEWMLTISLGKSSLRIKSKG